MPIPQQKFREIVFQLLFCQGLTLAEEEDILPFMMEQLRVTKKVVKEAMIVKEAVVKHLDAIDDKIRSCAQSYEFARIAQVEKTALRLAVYEMCYHPEAFPPKVAIAEAIRLTRKFSVGESSSFVNAVLDAILKNSDRIQEEEHVCTTPVSLSTVS